MYEFGELAELGIVFGSQNEGWGLKRIETIVWQCAIFHYNLRRFDVFKSQLSLELPDKSPGST